jgi:hypothetical protein
MANTKHILQINATLFKNNQAFIFIICGKNCLLCRNNTRNYMIQRFFKQNWIHFVAIAIFFLAIYVYMTPAFQGKVLFQHDTTGWRQNVHNAQEYSKTHDGYTPFWNPNVFSGMPSRTG